MKILIKTCLILALLSLPGFAASQTTVPDFNRPWTGDLDGMIERRTIRVLVPYSRTLYFLDGPTPRGIVHDMMMEFENSLNEALERGLLRVNVVFLPTTRDQLIPALLDGRGDIVAANLTITPERAKLVDFTHPLAQGVREVVISHSSSASPASLNDLSGQVLLLNPASSYFEHLSQINAELQASGLAPIVIHPAPDHFETEDILEMVNAGLVDYTIADNYIAGLWAQVLPELRIHEDVVLSQDNQIAFAVRPGSEALKAELDRHLAQTRKGTLTGNILFSRYFENTRFVSAATQQAGRERFLEIAQLFIKHAGEHQLDWLMITAQGYQESRLDHSVVSPAGAVGIMQLLPATAADMGVEDARDLEGNISAGVKYVRFLIDNFFDDPAISETNRLLFALAAYNAGPGRIRTLRREAGERGLDPNRWFNHVEHVVAEKIGRETVQYVSNIYKYYVAYSLVVSQGLDPELSAR